MEHSSNDWSLCPVLGRTMVVSLGAAEVGVWMLSERELILIDSGTMECPGFVEYLVHNGYEVRAILQTHLHIDHIANNDLLIRQFGCAVYACESELPDAAFSGRSFSYPIHTNSRDEAIVVNGARFETVFTPGHTEGHQMIITPDGVCCVGDAIMSMNRLKTAKVPYMRDVAESILSMERIRETAYPVYLAAHRGLISRDELSKTVDENIRIELHLYELLRGLVTEPITMEDLKQKFMLAAGLTSPRVMAFRFMHITSEARIRELIYAGELQQRGEFICPV